MNQPSIDTALAIIDGERQALVDLCLRLGNEKDYAGHERGVAQAVVQWLGEAGIEAWLQELGPTSANAVGLLRGHGTGAQGRSLILNAHLDTQGTCPAAGAQAEREMRGAWVDGDMIYGQGLANDKAQLAAEMLAMRAIRQAGIELDGNLWLAGVAQETSVPFDTAIDRRSGIGPKASQVGEGTGARWLVENGVVADFALVAEVSDFRVSVAQAGYLRLRIAVPGTVPYTPALSRGDTPATNGNPFERAAHVVLAFECWARQYEVDGRMEFWGGTLVPKAQVYEIGGSGPAWTEAEDYCYVFVDVRLVPGADPEAVRRSLAKALGATGLPLQVTPYDYKRGYVAAGAEPLLEALRDAHRRVRGEPLQFAGSMVQSMWRDANAFNENGIAAIGYGPGTQDAAKFVSGRLAGMPRPIAVDDLLQTAKVIAATSLQVCRIANGS